jgi:hypothetical protein
MHNAPPQMNMMFLIMLCFVAKHWDIMLRVYILFVVSSSHESLTAIRILSFFNEEYIGLYGEVNFSNV